MEKQLIYDQVKNWIMPFGKYKGERILDVYETNPSYIEYIHQNLEDGHRTKQAIELLCFSEEKREEIHDKFYPNAGQGSL